MPRKANNRHFSPTVLAYASTLLELLNERSQVDAVQGELHQLREIFEQNPQLTQLLSDPTISSEDRAGVVERTFKNQVSELTWNFLRVLNQRGALRHLPRIVDALDHLVDEQRGRIEVDLTVAHRLDDQQLQAVQQRIGQALHKDAVIHQFVDESIIGGLVLKIQDKLIDASVRYQLQAMRRQLLEARPR